MVYEVSLVLTDAEEAVLAELTELYNSDRVQRGKVPATPTMTLQQAILCTQLTEPLEKMKAILTKGR